MGLRAFADGHPWLTRPVVVVTAIAIFGSVGSVVLLCRARPRLRGPLATVAWFAWPRLGQVLALATVITAFGCVYVSVHYTSDVIAGALIGAAAAAVTWAASGLGWVSAVLAAVDSYAARLGGRIPSPSRD